MPGIYTEKEIYGDALSAQKACTSQFNLAANECTHEDVRQTMMKILNQEHDIQKSVFDNMHAAGFYPTPAAEDKKVQVLGHYIYQADNLLQADVISMGKYEELLLDAFRDDIVFGGEEEGGDVID